MENQIPHVYTAIVNVMADMAKDGVAKTGRNTQQGYAFRGIDSIYNALSPKLATHGLCILPRVVAKEASERESKNGGVLLYTRLTVEFDLVSAKDGSKHTICTVGEAMDSADKSSNKAMASAYKYAAFMAFCIPTEGDNDADATTHEVAATYNQTTPRPIAPQKPAQQATNGLTPVCDVCGAVGRLSKNGTSYFCSNKQAHDGEWYTIPTQDTEEWDTIDAAAASR